MSSNTSFTHLSKVWLIGGTSESVTIFEQLQQHQIPTIVTVTTPGACHNYPPSPESLIIDQRFTDDQRLIDWLKHSKISGILDASHPFATEISHRAMRVATALELSYLRFEREALTALQSHHIKEIALGSQSLSHDVLSGQRVLLTVGSQALPQFSQYQDCAQLFARILPSQNAIKSAYDAGFSRDRIIALQPPISFDLECALWRQWDISLVITKASGHAGGEDIKRQAAEKLRIPLLIIQRPQIDYPWQTQSIKTALHFGQKVTNPLSQDS